jgi:hypothetical protein
MAYDNATKYHRKSRAAKWRDLLFPIPHRKTQWKHNLRLCHPDRSEAQWRDLQFRGPFLEMFSTFSSRTQARHYR